MILNIRSILIIFVVTFSDFALADVSCGIAQINQILVYNDKIVVLHGNTYRGLGFTSTAKNQDKKLSVVLTAKASGAQVEMRYPDDYDCATHNYGRDPTMVILN